MSALRQLFGGIFAGLRESAGVNTLTLDGPPEQCSLSSGVEEFVYVYDGSALYTAADSNPTPALATMLVFDSFGAFVFNFTPPTIPGSIALVSGDGTAVLTISGTEADIFDFVAGAMPGALVTSPVPFPQAVTQGYPVQLTISNAHGSAAATTDYTAITTDDSNFVTDASGTTDLGLVSAGTPKSITLPVFGITVTNGNADAQLALTIRTDTSDSNMTFTYTPGTETGVVATGNGTTHLTLTGVYDQIRNIFDNSSGATVTGTAVANNGDSSFGISADLNVINQPCLITVNSLGISVSYDAEPYHANAVNDAGAAYLLKVGPPAISVHKGTLSFWAKIAAYPTGGQVGFEIVWAGTPAGTQELHSFIFTDGALHVTLNDRADAGNVYAVATPAASIPVGVWTHIAYSFDVTNAAGARVSSAAIDGVAQALTLVADTGVGFNVTYGDALTVCDNFVTGGTLLPFIGDIAETFYAPGHYLDLTVAANLLKFRTAAGKPALLGPTGEQPFGVQPGVYVNQPAATWNVNAGSAGNFLVVGAPTDAATSPSD